MTDCRRLLIASVFVASAAAAGAAEPAADPAAVALEDLRAANAARAAEAREWQQWQVESERTYALLDAVQGQVARLRADATAAREAAAKLRQETEAAGETRRQLVRLDSTFAAQASAIAHALDQARAATVPGAVPAVAEAGDPRARFTAAVRALEAAERAAASTSVEVVEGDLDGQARAVTMLRVAGLGWWCEIDGPRAGLVEPQASGRPRLAPASDGAQVEAIRRAIAIAQGARPPELLVVPVASSSISGAGK